MPSGAEALGQQSGLQAALDAAVEQVSQQTQVQFQRYEKKVLEQDGFVFWVATGETMTATGSLHYATDRLQDEDQTIGTNHVLLTSEGEITQFNAVSPTSMWIGSWPLHGDAPALKVAFAQRGNYYQPSNIWHYSGFAVYPALQSQIIDSAADLPAGPIVSNSLPIWLSQNDMAPVYSSFLVPDNIVPPYIVAHVESTEALGAFPIVGQWPGTTDPNSGASPMHELAISQLMRDEVKLTLYGFSNQAALQYLQRLIDASIDESAPFGFANSPAITDAKRPQVEISTLAQKKTLIISANYYQSAADVVARRLILSASFSNVYVRGGVPLLAQIATTQSAQFVAGEGTVIE